MKTKEYIRPKSLKPTQTHYCPGCTHGIIHRILAEVLDEMNLREKAVAVIGVGCSCFAERYFNFDCIDVAHGRAPAVATGVKRANPNLVTITYQGDGDMTAIGSAEALHAAIRGEKITSIMINNAIYGMTGGQMSPTTLIGQKTSTSPYGKKAEEAGYPVRFVETLALQEGVAYAARTAVNNIGNILKTKAAIKKALQAQIDGKGYSIVEILSTCPTNWGVSPKEALKWIEEKMIPVFPLGEFKEI
ncbi:thiamine pyrophosphate-dependent enzyme [Carboxydothermus hydrogenoformans]|uniref:Putative keto/oxoacid ferredoxin oxidoreductase, beta subunit n=1 Tax=Carboxydothermus hydrogenoformans (strain ATCC BAA-161 / DSM 6008 / Z-2901) TaxID=246194 RepID=Q3ACI8_CARHZ|nr:thiamine pyrophosphate-dependent enzyme [Carboxydothermus hydrogenoformans]ABB14499.1 putative keto/oxoacid ferredoxin oxidoreductase, beta subunit [Carboxydothermus hydrogenoformans Z-2901]